jgi:hypothetical protein
VGVPVRGHARGGGGGGGGGGVRVPLARDLADTTSSVGRNLFRVNSVS